MKKMLAMILFFTLAAGTVPAFAAELPCPVIQFSDLTSGPKDGGKDNNGVFVTIVGRHFGSSRGGSYVTVGGGQAAGYPVWSDNKISFQLGPNASSGDIVVNTAAGKSNGIHFSVRGGRIFFVDDSSPGNPGSGTYDDPWRSPASYFGAQQPGDTCYFRGGLYNGRYGSSSRSYNVSFYNMGVPSGSKDNEIAWVGYPGETAQFKADDGTVNNGAFEFNSNNQYFVVAGLGIYGRGEGREQVRLYSNNLKLVNCKIEGIKTLSYAMIGVIGADIKIWGNECFGAKSRNKLDHIVYFQSGGQIRNVDVGWNYIHDNDIAVGPVFSWNLGSGTAYEINIHDNRIDCRNSSDVLRLAGIWSGTGGSITFANNIVIGAGGSLNNDGSYNAIYAGFGDIKIYNNTFYLSRGAGSNYVVNIYGGASGDVKNNIFFNQSNISYVSGNAKVDSNLYFGGSGSVPSGDAHAVREDPRFVNPSSMNLHITAASPANGKGADISSAVPRDFDGVVRARGAVAIGAYQYYEGGAYAAVSDGGSGTTIEGSSEMVRAGQVRVVGGSSSRGAVNPCRGESARIYFQGSAQGNFKCRIFNLTGDLVWDSAMDNVQGGVFDWTPQSMASGIYLANVTGPGIRTTQKIAVLQ